MIGAILLLPLSAFVASMGQIYLLLTIHDHVLIFFFFLLYNVASLNVIVKTCVVARIVIIIIIIIGHELEIDRPVSVSPNGLFKGLLILLMLVIQMCFSNTYKL